MNATTPSTARLGFLNLASLTCFPFRRASLQHIFFAVYSLNELASKRDSLFLNLDDLDFAPIFKPPPFRNTRSALLRDMLPMLVFVLFVLFCPFLSFFVPQFLSRLGKQGMVGTKKVATPPPPPPLVYLNVQILYLLFFILRGQGWSPTENSMLCYLCRGQAELFTGSKNIDPSRIYCIF